MFAAGNRLRLFVPDFSRSKSELLSLKIATMEKVSMHSTKKGVFALATAMSMFAVSIVAVTATAPKVSAAPGDICIIYNGVTQCLSSPGQFHTNCSNWSYSAGNNGELGFTGMADSVKGDEGYTFSETITVTRNSDGSCTAS